MRTRLKRTYNQRPHGDTFHDTWFAWYPVLACDIYKDAGLCWVWLETVGRRTTEGLLHKTKSYRLR